MDKRAQIVVSGRVQGVAYRAWAQRVAWSLGLTGFVRNLPEGDVEIIAEGEAEQLERLVASARRGPTAAIVRNLQVYYSEPTGAYVDFAIES